MIVYDGIKSDFLKSVADDTIANTVAENIYEKMHRVTGKAEFRSWENSLKNMFIVLSDQAIPSDTGIAIEYNIPQTSKRVDFLVSGYDKEDDANVVIIELKQWEEMESIQGKEALVSTYTGGGIRQVVHPSYQAWSYASLIADYNQAVQDGRIRLSPCVYMHNYSRKPSDPLDEQQYATYLDEAPAFTKGQVSSLQDFIKERIVSGDKEELLYSVENGKIRPSKSLQDTIANMLKGNPEFVMLDEQKVVYEDVLEASKLSMEDGKKRVIIVKGGPGTGKTVVAVNLLAQLTQEGQFCQYVSKNSAPRSVYLAKLKGEIKKSSVDNMFKGPGIYVDMEENVIDTILADEAHRLNAKSGIYHNYGENQIKEIINAAKCSVFFLDEEQRVTFDDIGSVDEIVKWADEAGAQITITELVSQFRCNGSDGYLAWLDNTLEIKETANYDMEGIDFDIRILDSPEEVRDLIVQQNIRSRNRARILAGYCWEWIKDGKNRSDVHDIQIGDFEMSWNLGNTSTYAIDESSIDEIGCIHTAQGLEFDYVGVIIGDDMRFEDGHIHTDGFARASTDHSIKGFKTLYKKNPEEADRRADEIIKNTYRTLMSRGMKGCYVYCTDPNLAEHLRECLKAQEENKFTYKSGE